MLNGVNGFYIEAGVNSGSQPFLLQVTYPLDGSLLPPGTTVYASIALSGQTNVYLQEDPVSPSDVGASFVSWTTYYPDGSRGGPIFNDDIRRNIVYIPNCASITFRVFVENCAGVAQVSVFNF
jgi:hypothetical protein